MNPYATPQKKLCKQCGVLPAWDGHPYCGKGCAAQAKVSPRQVDGAPDLWAPRSQSSTTLDDDDDDDDQGGSDDDDGTMCKRCKVRPRFQDHPFCGKACAEASKAEPTPVKKPKRDQQQLDRRRSDDRQVGPSQTGFPHNRMGMCMFCHRNPKHPSHDFCSRFCLNQAMSRMNGSEGGGSRISKISRAVFNAGPPIPRGPPCKLPECQKPTATDKTEKYCSDRCRESAVTQGLEVACLLCKKMPKTPKKHYCSKKCGVEAESKAPMILDVPKSDPKFKDIVQQFNASWKGNNLPTVERICKLINLPATETRYQKYRQSVEANGQWVAKGKSAGNELRRWHGTVRQCNVGDTAGNLTLCQSTACRMCSIVRTSFDMKYNVRGAYGMGIYTSSYSSVSHGYTGQTTGSPYRAMFLTRIVGGKEHIYTNISAGSPPAGHDSVAVGADHNMLIVFRNEAICPSWLVLYK